MNGRFKGRVALVTGAGRGIGRAIAMELAAGGATAVVNYNGSEKAAAETVDMIAATGGEAIAMQCAINDFAAVEEMIKKIYKEYGSIDILVNNAGITKDDLILKMKEEDFDKVIDSNLKGSFNTMRHVARYMIKQRKGSIVNISSVSCLLGNPGQINYCASKAGVIGMTKSMAHELASRNIRVNAVAPGFIATQMVEKMTEGARESSVAMIPLGHFGEPEDVARAVAFLASDDAAYITGQVLCVDGGLS